MDNRNVVMEENVKNRILVYSINLIEIVLQALIFLAVSLVLSFALFPTEDASVFMCIMVSVVPIVVLYIARFVIGNGLIIFIIHIAVALLIFNAGRTSEESLSYVIMGIAEFIFSMLLRSKGHKRESEKMPVPLIAVFMAVIIIGDFVENEMLAAYGLFAGVVYIILNILHRNLTNFNAFIVINRGTANFPLKQMSMVNGFIMFILITICGGVMLICGNKYVYNMFSAITAVGGDIGTVILRFLFSLFGRGEAEEVGMSGMPEKSAGALPEPEAANELMKAILDAIAFIVMTIIVVALLIGLTVMIVRLIRNLKSHNDLESDVKEFITPEGISLFNLKRQKRERTDKSEQMNIRARKLYKATVKKNAGKMGRSISDNMFPADISEQYIYGRKDEATQIYEKARYSNKQITKEEIECLKGIQKNK